MTAGPRTAERRITAFMENPDAPRPENPIHSTGGGQEYGFRAALVGGVTVYGWAAPAIIEALGERWLGDGWVEVGFRRPTYPGDEMTARLIEQDGQDGQQGVFALVMTNQDEEVCLRGTAGLGDAPFLDGMVRSQRREAEPRPAELPAITLANAPVGMDVRPQAVPISAADARVFAAEHEADDHPRYRGERPLIHPGWLAARMSPFMHHSFEYAPSIHAHSHIQHLARAEAGQTVTVAGHLVEVYERNGHHYLVADGLIIGEDGTELALVRHTTIFNVAKRGRA
ncbi:MAG: hypothetical protein QF664_12745 [Dehalococcoidia bacterium]|jgi:hypothetical protein|nr:hypothetical protein [Dehalococcoidia bacterium]